VIGEGAAAGCCCALALPVKHKAAKAAAKMAFLNMIPSLKVWPGFGRLF
jgi:hypothetical protein